MMEAEGIKNIKKLASLNLFAHKIYSSNPENPTRNNMNITDKEALAFLQALNDHNIRFSKRPPSLTSF